jgi:rRNA large subunit m3Psi methyltransferase RlmH
VAKTIRLYVGGRVKNSLFQGAWDTYNARIRHWSIQTIECGDKQFETLRPRKGELWIALDEGGISWSSPQFCQKLIQWVEGPTVPCFLIGPSDGLPPELVASCTHCLSFSPMTWPHLMARVLLIEQIYRAQQRLLNHPYSFV